MLINKNNLKHSAIVDRRENKSGYNPRIYLKVKDKSHIFTIELATLKTPESKEILVYLGEFKVRIWGGIDKNTFVRSKGKYVEIAERIIDELIKKNDL